MPSDPKYHRRKKLSPAEKQRIYSIFQTFAKENPTPTGELKYTNPFTLLIAVVLSAQSTDERVNMVTQTLFLDIHAPQDIITMGIEKLTIKIKTIGLYRTKAKNIYKLSQMLIQHHQGKVPETLAELIALPGVGRKTANVVLNIAFGKPTLAVDTHVFRVSHRLGLAQGNTPDSVEQQLMAIVPHAFLEHAHHWLILHGRYICKARKSLCHQCPIAELCPSCQLNAETAN